jgi:hypothetical protein
MDANDLSPLRVNAQLQLLYVQDSMQVTKELILLLSLLKVIRDRQAFNFKFNAFSNRMLHILKSDFII